MRKFIFILAALFMLTFPQAAIAEDSLNLVVDGQVINKTEDGGSVTGVDVSLISFLNETQEGIETSKTDEQGKFQFTSLSADYQYLLLVTYMGVDYYYEISFSDGETQISIEIPVFDTTTSDQAIRIILAHVIIRVEAETISVSKVLWLENTGDQLYMAEEGVTDGTLVFTLPAEATNFEASENLISSYVLLSGNKFVYDVPFEPGEMQLSYSYDLARPDSDDYSTTLYVDYVIDEFHLLVEGEDVEVSSTQLLPAEPIVTSEEKSYLHLTGGNLPRGATLDVQFSSLNKGGISIYIIILIIVAAIALGIIIYAGIREKSRPATSKIKVFRHNIESQIQSLQRELAQLNEDFKQGLISEDLFQQMSSEKNSQLTELKLKGGEDDTLHEQ
ncbi:carboxypeptidase-like regulatory domain-containing protein [Chloroflexota bacterium]